MKMMKKMKKLKKQREYWTLMFTLMKYAITQKGTEK